MDTILEYVKYWSDVTPDKKAYIFSKNNTNDVEYVTFKQVYDEACKHAGFFHKRGIKREDRVIIFGNQNAETIYSIYGTLMLGAVFVLIPKPVDQAKYERLKYTINSSEAKYLISAKEEIKYLKDDLDIRIINTAYMDEKLRYIEKDIRKTDVACLQYTSGSINEPKGIIWTHKNIIESLKSLSKYTFSEDNFVTWLPFFHSMGLLTGVLLNMYVNNTNIILETKRFINNPLEWLIKISEYKSTMVWAPNSTYLTCAELLPKDNKITLDLSSIKYLINCSESIHTEDWNKISDSFCQYGLRKDALYTVYGLSESTGEVSGGRVYNLKIDASKLDENIIERAGQTSDITRILSSVGSIIDDLKVIIVNPETFKEVNNNEIGEVWIQGDKVANGYWNNEKTSRDTFEAELTGYEGNFLRTGDLGCVYEGQLYILGRMKEMFIVNGHNIFLSDIDASIKGHVRKLMRKVVHSFSIVIDNKERLVIGIEGKLQKDEYDKVALDVKKTVYKYYEIEPYDIFVVNINGLIRTDNGKIAINKNKKAYLDDKLEILYSTRNKIRSHKSSKFTQKGLDIKKIFEDVLETECVSMDDDFFELGGSSLKTVVLLKKISSVFDVEITSEDLIGNSTIAGIEKMVSKKKAKGNGNKKRKNEVMSEVAVDIDKEDKKTKKERLRKADACINNDIRIRNIETYYPDNKISVDEIINEFKDEVPGIEVLVREQLCKDTLYLCNDEKESGLTLAYAVVDKILKSSGLEGKDFDLIAVSATVPEYVVPVMALLIHHRIKGKKDAVCYDINVNCSGMITGMTQIYRRMESDSRINRALLIGTEYSVVHMRKDDYKMRANLSDASCAVIFERSETKSGLIDSKTHVTIDNIEDYAFPGCGFSNIYKSKVEDYYTVMGIARWNTEEVGTVIKGLLKENYLKLEDLALICSSQLVGFNLKLLRKYLNVSEDKLMYIGDKYGYTGTCSPFTVLYEGIKKGLLKRGDYVLFWTVASGGYYIFTLIKY